MTTYYKISYTTLALKDLSSIYTYISSELKIPNIAKKQIENIQTSISKLDILPFRHAKVA